MLKEVENPLKLELNQVAYSQNSLSGENLTAGANNSKKKSVREGLPHNEEGHKAHLKYIGYRLIG